MTQPAWKRSFYYLCTTILGMLVSFGLHAVIELLYLRWADASHHVIRWYHVFGGSCALHPAVAYGLLALGILLGALAGPIWWRWVYIEGKRWSKPPFHHSSNLAPR